MTSPDFANPPAPPFTFTATSEDIAAAGQAIIDRLHAVLDQVAAVPLDQASFANVCRPLIELEDHTQHAAGPLDIYERCSPRADVRAAAAAANHRCAQAQIDAQRADVFARLEAVYQNGDTPPSGEYRKWLAEERRRYVRQGLRLPAATRAQYQALQKELAGLHAAFTQNDTDEPPAAGWFAPAELAGIPADQLAGLERGDGDGDGGSVQIKIPLSRPDNVVMRYCTVAATRQKASAIVAARGTAGPNVRLYQEQVRLQGEAARLLGYASTAAYQLEAKMAQTPAAVHAFLQDLHRRGRPTMQAAVERLLARKNADLAARGQPPEDTLYSWDTQFYRRIDAVHQQREQREQAEQSEHDTKGRGETGETTDPEGATSVVDPTPAYFPLWPTVAKMLALFGSLLGFVFVEVPPASPAADRLSPTGCGRDLVWHEDVRLYAVWDDDDDDDGGGGGGGAFRGYLYLDLYAREGKHQGFRCCPVTLGFEHGAPQTETTTRTYPSTCLLTIFPPPASAATPCLLTHGEMRLLFHELGHGIHDLSGQATCSRFFGVSTAGDFNEAPSQMLELWCYDPRGLRALSGHYQTGAPLPEALVQTLVAAKRSDDLWTMMGMLHLALWDLEVHAQGDPTVPGHDDDEDDENKTKTKTLADVMAEAFLRPMDVPGYAGLPAPPPHGYVRWPFLAGSDGACSMYQYLWSKVFAVDMFYAAFRADPLDGAAGRRYRHGVLEKGATQDEKKTLEDFMGRPPSADAYFQDMGLE